MYEGFYQMKRSPFGCDIPTDQLYLTRRLDEALGRLEHAAERQLFAVVTGHCGTGKTTVIRKLLDELKGSKYKVLYLSDSKLTLGARYTFLYTRNLQFRNR